MPGESMRSTRQRRRNEREGAPRAPSFTGREDDGGALSRDREGLGIPGEGGLCRQRDFQQPGEMDSVVGFRTGEVGEARRATQP